MAEQFTFPQNGDKIDAEHFASLAGQDNITNYVQRGMSFTVDFTVPEVTVSTGKAFIKTSNGVAPNSGDTILDLSFVIQIPEQTVSLADNDTNYIYLEPNINSDDAATINSYTSTQSSPLLLTGTIDTSNDTSTESNRAPSANFLDTTVSELDTRGDITDGSQVIWDTSAQEIPDNAMGAIDNATLTNSNITVSSGDGLKGGGTVALGGSTTINAEPDDFAGTFLSDDGSDNLTVDIGRGLENDGSGNIRFDEDVDFTFTQHVDFSAGIDIQGDITDGSQIIWDVSAQEIPDSAMGAIENSTLSNSTVTVSAGNGIKGGGTTSLGGSTTLNIEPADFAGSFLTDDGSDNLQVNIGRGLESDGSGNISFDEDTDYTFTAIVDFSAGFDTQGDITDGAQTIWDASASYIDQTALENDSVTVTAGDTLTGGGTVALGGSTTLNLDTVPNSKLANSSVTITAGDGLKSGGTVALGSSITLDVEPADFAGDGVGDDGSDNLRTDEDFAHTWTVDQTFNAGWTMGGNSNAASNRIRNLPEPTNNDEAARKQYVDGVAQGLDLKDSVKVSTAGQNIDLTSSTDPNPIDGYTLSDGERILLRNQNTSSENGIYDANTATDPTTWTRSSDFDEDDEVTNGSFTFVENGTNDGSTSWIVTTDDPITVGSTAITFSQFASAGEISAGDGLDKSGQTLSVDVSDFAGVFLSDDGSNNLTVDVGRGLENDGSNNIRVDEDTDFTFSQQVDFSTGFVTSSDIVDGSSAIIWDSSAQYIPQGRLQNDSITVSSGDGLKGGGSVALGGSTTLSVEPANFAGTYLSDDGSDNLQVDIGFGLENDGSGNIRFDEDAALVLTSKLNLTGGLDMNQTDATNFGSIEMDGDINGGGFDFDLTEVSRILGPKNGNTSLELRTQGDGTHDITLRDGFNGQDMLVANEGGPVVFPSNNVDIDNQLNIGFINGSQGFKIEPGNDRIRYDGSNVNFWNGVQNLVLTDSGELQVPQGDITSGDTNSALELDEATSIADGGKTQLSRDAQAQGYAMIQDVTNNNSMMVYLGGSAGVVEILHDSGSGDNFSTVEDQDGTTNIYYDSTNSQYELNNETGASATYSFQIMKA